MVTKTAEEKRAHREALKKAKAEYKRNPEPVRGSRNRIHIKKGKEGEIEIQKGEKSQDIKDKQPIQEAEKKAVIAQAKVVPTPTMVKTAQVQTEKAEIISSMPASEEKTNQIVLQYNVLVDEYRDKLSVCSDADRKIVLFNAKQRCDEFLRNHPNLGLVNPFKKIQIDSKENSSPIHSLKWSDVIFCDGYIKLGKFYGQYECRCSRSSLNRLKGYISNLQLPKIKIQIIDAKVVVKNVDLLNDIVLVMSVKNDMDYLYNSSISSRLSELIARFNQIKPQYLKYLYGQQQDVRYISYLAERRDCNYKIVPVRERVMNNDMLRSEDDGFIFTIAKGSKLYLVWESIDTGKASFVFETSHDNHSADIQRLFNYIVSDQNNKRLTLFSDDKYRRIYHYVCRPWHTSLQEWKGRMPFW